MNSLHKKLIWTNHAQERQIDRKIPKRIIDDTFIKPDRCITDAQKKTLTYVKSCAGHIVTLVIKKTEKKEYLLLSVWAAPPFSGSIDIARRKRYLAYKESKGFKHIILYILKALGFYTISYAIIYLFY